ncbi:MAG: DUF6733 family protein [Cyclobacteriaceae bacterium]
MKKIYILALAVFFSLSVFAQDEEESKFGMDVSLNTDAFFGYAPAAFGSYSLSDGLDFTFYGIFWSPGTGQNWGAWTEFGLGVNFSAGNFDINPAIGVLGGSLLSGTTNSVPSVPQFPDGIVPNLTVNYSADVIEGNFYFGYYAGLSEGQTAAGVDVASTFNYIHYWASLGFITADWLSLGLRYEQLDLAGGSGPDTDPQAGYASFGPYVTFADPKGGSYLSFNVGANLADEDERFFTPGEFWKLTLGYSF